MLFLLELIHFKLLCCLLEYPSSWFTPPPSKVLCIAWWGPSADRSSSMSLWRAAFCPPLSRAWSRSGSFWSSAFYADFSGFWVRFCIPLREMWLLEYNRAPGNDRTWWFIGEWFWLWHLRNDIELNNYMHVLLMSTTTCSHSLLCVLLFLLSCSPGQASPLMWNTWAPWQEGSTPWTCSLSSTWCGWCCSVYYATSSSSSVGTPVTGPPSSPSPSSSTCSWGR